MSESEHELWLKKAQEDFTVIEALQAIEFPPYSMICYHAQQAAEKHFKALLVSKGISPPKTHDLVRLLTMCEEAGFDLGDLFDQCESLLRFASATRYPGEASAPTVAQAHSCVSAAREIEAAIRGQLA
jgi:HEPN domain-containing protein